MRTFLIIVIGLLAIGVGSYFGYKKYQSLSRQRVAQSQGLNGSGNRQAVFLTNGQVYFGYISGVDQSIVVLRDIYYFKAADLANNTDKAESEKLSLVKLGDEIQGPEDTMYINREHILFFENMREDSKVNEAIKKHKDEAK